MEIKELVEKLSTAGDVAATALGYVAGIAADTYFFAGGLEGSVVAAVTAVGFAGAKKLVDAVQSEWENERKHKLEQRVEALTA